MYTQERTGSNHSHLSSPFRSATLPQWSPLEMIFSSPQSPGKRWTWPRMSAMVIRIYVCIYIQLYIGKDEQNMGVNIGHTGLVEVAAHQQSRGLILRPGLELLNNPRRDIQVHPLLFYCAQSPELRFCSLSQKLLIGEDHMFFKHQQSLGWFQVDRYLYIYMQ